jgi:hypothetical protein
MYLRTGASGGVFINTTTNHKRQRIWLAEWLRILKNPEFLYYIIIIIIISSSSSSIL